MATREECLRNFARVILAASMRIELERMQGLREPKPEQ